MPPGLNSARLFAQLLNTGLQQRDNPLYQIIFALIGDLAALQKANSSGSSGGGSSTNIINQITQVLSASLLSNSDDDSYGYLGPLVAPIPVTPLTIPEYNSDPSSPGPEEVWVLRTGTGTIPDGTPIGLLLGLTYTGAVGAFTYELSYRTIEGTTVRVTLS